MPNRLQTRSATADLVGAVYPRVLTVPQRAGTKIRELELLMQAVGLVNDPWQHVSLDMILSVRADGKWAATEVGELVARQQGKGNILLAYELGHLILWPRPDGKPKLILHTAHQYRTAVEAFLRLKSVILANPALRKELKGGGEDTGRGIAGITEGNSGKGFEMRNGNRLLFMARTANAGVGFTVDNLIVDEAQQTPMAAIEALLPTLTTAPNGQILLTGTVPDLGNDAEYFEGVRDRGRAGSDLRTGWIEYSPKGSEDPHKAPLIDLGDPVNWAQANPGLGHRLGLETIEDEYSRLAKRSPDSFARERLSIWPNALPDSESSNNDVDIARWQASMVPNGSVVHGNPRVLAVSLGRGGGWSSISMASRLPDGRVYVEHLKTAVQALWVPAALSALKDEYDADHVVLDGKNCAAIIPDMQSAKLAYKAMNAVEIAGAFDLFIEQANSGVVIHRGQDELTLSLKNASPRKVGSYGFTWDQADPSEPVTQIASVTLAVWGVHHLEANPVKRRSKAVFI